MRRMKMKAKTKRHAFEVRLFAVVLLATCVFAAAANAQTLAAKFTLPFEVHWGRNVLPAGEYTVTMDSTTNVALIRSANGETVGFSPVPTRATSHSGTTALFVMVRGNERLIRSLNLPTSGISLIYPPTSSAQREMLANADRIKSVPVITAGK
jgi:hypothetical protein